MTIKTIEQVKDELPDVKIKINGRIVTGWIRGRKLPYAQVCFGHYGPCFEFSWETVTNAINNNLVLKAV